MAPSPTVESSTPYFSSGRELLRQNRGSFAKTRAGGGIMKRTTFDSVSVSLARFVRSTSLAFLALCIGAAPARATFFTHAEADAQDVPAAHDGTYVAFAQDSGGDSDGFSSWDAFATAAVNIGEIHLDAGGSGHGFAGGSGVPAAASRTTSRSPVRRTTVSSARSMPNSSWRAICSRQASVHLTSAMPTPRSTPRWPSTLHQRTLMIRFPKRPLSQPTIKG